MSPINDLSRTCDVSSLFFANYVWLVFISHQLSNRNHEKNENEDKKFDMK